MQLLYPPCAYFWKLFLAAANGRPGVIAAGFRRDGNSHMTFGPAVHADGHWLAHPVPAHG